MIFGHNYQLVLCQPSNSCWPAKNPESILRKNEDQGLSLFNVTLYNKAVEIKTVWYEPRTAGQCNTLESPDINTRVSRPSTWLSKTCVREGVRVLYLFVNFCLPACSCVYGDNFQELVLSLWAPESKLRFLGLAAGSPTHWSISPTVMIHKVRWTLSLYRMKNEVVASPPTTSKQQR